MLMLQNASKELRQYAIVTGNYWVFTLTDGALRMLVVLYFHQLGYQPLQIALLFIFYEVFGVLTNLMGGWLGARWGLNKTMNVGLLMQFFALSMLLVPSHLLTVPWVMAAQALSGIAKDLNKMSAKSAIKLLVPSTAQGQLYQWIAILTGSKNALKGLGFFLGGFLLAWLGFSAAILALLSALLLIGVVGVLSLNNDLGKAKNKPKFTEIFSSSRAINYLSAARLCLFASRDVWFVVALPVYLARELHWGYSEVGAFLAVWVMGYGLVQGLSPSITGKRSGKLPGRMQALGWAMALSIVPVFMAFAFNFDGYTPYVLIIGLLIFGGLFAVNSAMHSYLIVSYARSDGVSLDVGFYYMANALGRLIGTVLSGWIFQQYGMAMCLWISAIFIAACAVLSIGLPKHACIENP